MRCILYTNSFPPVGGSNVLDHTRRQLSRAWHGPWHVSTRLVWHGPWNARNMRRAWHGLWRPADPMTGRPAGFFFCVFFYYYFFFMKIIKNDLKTKESGPGTFIFEFSVKFRFEWYQFRLLKSKPRPIGEKTVFPLKIVSR